MCCQAIDLRKCSSTLDAAALVELELQKLRTEVDAEAGRFLQLEPPTVPPPLDTAITTTRDDDGDDVVDVEVVEWDVALEEFMKSFGGGAFHTQGLFKLAQLNGIVAYQCTKIFANRPTGATTGNSDSSDGGNDDAAATSYGRGGGGVWLAQQEPRLFMPNAIRAFHQLKKESGGRVDGGDGSTSEEKTKNSTNISKPKNIKQVVWDRAAQELPTDLARKPSQIFRHPHCGLRMHTF